MPTPEKDRKMKDLNNELVSTHVKLLIEAALPMYALANMARASDRIEYMTTARGWVSQLEQSLANIRDEMARLHGEIDG